MLKIFRQSYTKWKFENHSSSQMLHEINDEDSRSSKTAICAILEALNFVLGKYQPSRIANNQ